MFQTLNEETWPPKRSRKSSPRCRRRSSSPSIRVTAADIVGEMDPDAAADLLADLPEDANRADPDPDGARGPAGRRRIAGAQGRNRRRTHDHGVSGASREATVQNAIDSLREFEGGVEAISTIYLVDSQGTLVAAVPLARIVLAGAPEPMLSLAQEPLVLAHQDATEMEVAEQFDKYNLQTLPVVDERNKLTGVITSDDVISMLRSKL